MTNTVFIVKHRYSLKMLIAVLPFKAQIKLETNSGQKEYNAG